MSRNKFKLPPKAAQLTKSQDLTYLTNIERKGFGIEQDYPKPFIVLKYFQPSYQCFSSWNADELKAFSRLITNMRETTWSELTTKGALGFSIHKYLKALPKDDVKCLFSYLSPDITFSELKVIGRARIHGFQLKSAFFLVWLDRNHDIHPMS